MACEAAVVASATGGIVEVVRDGETGFLVPLEQAPGSIEPVDPEGFARGLAGCPSITGGLTSSRRQAVPRVSR